MRTFLALLLSASSLFAQADYSTLLLLGNTQLPPQPTPDLLHFKMDENTGTNLTCSVSTNTGWLFEATWTTGTGNSPYALQFDGSNDYFRSAGNVVYGTNIITVAFWLYWDSFANNDDLALESSATFVSYLNTFNIDPNASAGNWSTGIRGTSGFRAETVTRPSAAAWHHYLFVLDNTTTAGDVRTFIDGVEQSETVGTNTKSGTSNFAANTLFGMSRNGTTLFGAGRMTALKIYTGDRSASVLSIQNDP